MEYATMKHISEILSEYFADVKEKKESDDKQEKSVA